MSPFGKSEPFQGAAIQHVGATRCMGLLLNITYDPSIPVANVEQEHWNGRCENLF
jgi:hypothetical protein